MTNILEAIYNIVNQKNFEIRDLYSGRNRANGMGDALENYIKDAFAGTLGITDEFQKMKIYNQKFSWLGSQNNPPDIMIKGGDAIEVKKTQSANSSLALNSSYPKTNLKHTSPMITKECKECENWTVKDLIYCVGHTNDTNLKSLWMVYGNSYAAKHETYQRIKTTISDGIKTISDVIFSETKELGRVNQVDPLGITNLRIRGMWQIENPRKVFSYLHKPTGKNFELVAIIPTDKYNNFPKESKTKLKGINENGFSIENTQIKDPNNPAKLIDCKLIKLCL
ncbi:NgoPII family restriction endonuclease [Tenacibaculum finnmarkense]|uniref:NgoPII family restriction endonuclease n=2 Tax=Tenacibaculum finnmarkense TaxID=2781243 RepID=A0AAP1RGC7_9FLAO|nr:NgoPII family restriction endonuclease [Tenacibaculum finnmarkense]MBE7653506.1 NgoPII family restriction endonuclease [Tenacibaculum finnmarkense genomovar finnmarkense]MBE7695810.1 NgoPII family restriction endonuclease [Tenacibaculum finnmarkense genomovar finnmarkense]MCD8427940.1 NgoPII family restriction endonuclease [Tenacibaculum finnmarkense genomovar finnmarkense]MCG8220819.1 NgoPII family restriction endonuclease [Tenacibaculum finnmarkense genomovar finnmarkense]MCG8223533.1 Ngo